eukprot:TRINITY_DN5112_c0_g1_i2.p1 TRINITY_DN5112_c0_g1~~TRINITY_DN5112_c0_g1_i2.p1  ORF type:complete len:628 (-),score=234.74 TRINITY_DN5112_c0_g1_i2:1067-2728(-)
MPGGPYPGFNPLPPQLNQQKKNKNKKKGKKAQDSPINTANSPSPSPMKVAQANFMKEPTPANSKEAAPLPGAADWPPSLKNYVSRCFNQCVTDVDKDMVEVILKGKITAAASSNSLWTKNWDGEPLPSNLSNSKVVPVQGDLGSQGKVVRAGPGRGGMFGNKMGRQDDRSPKRRRRRSSSGGDSPNYGGNANMVPLGGVKGGKGVQLGVKTKKEKKAAKAAHFYSNPMSMDVDSDLATSALKMKRAARFGEDRDSGGGKRKKPLNLLSTLNDKLINGGDDWEESNVIDWEKFHVIGTCTKLEKPFLRLTEAPEASKVRPVPVLLRAVQKVKEAWVRDQDYHYACDQLKSIRQDLTVQGIRDTFTVQVYETHARVALEKGDYTEFNQCQSQLKMLYADIGGDNRLEFTAYRILYYMYTQELLDLTSALSALSAKEKEDECISHSIKLRSAWSQGNYQRFFSLYQAAPKMSGYLIDWFIDRERRSALTTIIKAYRVSITIDSVLKSLGFTGSEGMSDWHSFSAHMGLSYTDTHRDKLDCKTSMAALPLLPKPAEK